MDRIIFSLYIDIPDNNLEMDMGPFPGDDIERTVRVKKEYREYYERLTENQYEYACYIGADYQCFGRDVEYLIFKEQFPPHISEYNIINFYKFHLIEKLSKRYDEVLYVDLDVVFNTDLDFFEKHDLSEGIHLSARDVESRAFSYVDNAKTYNRRDPGIKYLLCVAMGYGIYDKPIYNTGIIGINRDYAEKLDYTNRLPGYLDLIDEVKQDNFFVKELTDAFDYNNEAIFSYLVHEHEVDCVDTTGPWNFNVRNIEQVEFDEAEKYIIHFIMKRFDWIWRD